MKEASSEGLAWVHQHAGPRAAVVPQRLADWHHRAQDRTAWTLDGSEAPKMQEHIPREPCVCMDLAQKAGFENMYGGWIVTSGGLWLQGFCGKRGQRGLKRRIG